MTLIYTANLATNRQIRPMFLKDETHLTHLCIFEVSQTIRHGGRERDKEREVIGMKCSSLRLEHVSIQQINTYHSCFISS